MKLAIGTVQFGTNYGVSSANGRVDQKKSKILNIARTKKLMFWILQLAMELVKKLLVNWYSDFKVITKLDILIITR